MKLGTQIKRDQLDIFITKTITLMTLSPATAISPYLSVLMQLLQAQVLQPTCVILRK